MFTRFTAITNVLVSLGKPISNDQMVRKIIRVLLKSWEIKATTLKELNDKKEMNFTAFMGNLKTHEMEMKVREEREPKKTGMSHSKPLLVNPRRRKMMMKTFP